MKNVAVLPQNLHRSFFRDAGHKDFSALCLKNPSADVFHGAGVEYFYGDSTTFKHYISFT